MTNETLKLSTTLHNRRLNILFTICFLLIAYCLLVLKASTINGYEPSIYGSTSLIVWVTIFIVTVFSVSIISYCLVLSKINITYVSLSFFLLILIRTMILIIPFVKGYVSWDGDQLIHYGIIKDIVYNGKVSDSDFYPIVHIFLSLFCMVADLYSLKFVSYSIIFISIFYVLGIYCLSKSVLDNKIYTLLSTLMIIVVLFDQFNSRVVPNGWSILLLPFLLYSYFKKTWEFKIISLLFIVLYAYIHPLASVFVCVSFISMYLINNFYIKFMNEEKELKSPFNLISISLIFFIPWILSFDVFHKRLNDLIYSLNQDSVAISPFNGYGNLASSLNMNLFDVTLQVIKVMGDDLIFIILSFLTLVLYINNGRNNERNLYYSPKFYGILVIYVTILVIYMLHFFGFVIPLNYFQTGRLITFHQLVTPLIVSFLFFNIIKLEKVKKRYLMLIISLTVIIASTISIYSLYESPYTMTPNNGVKDINLQGMKWFLENKNETISSARILVVPTRYYSVLLGSAEAKNRKDATDLTLPSHFNYSNNSNLGNEFDSNKYFSLFDLEKNGYTTIWKNADRFNENDFKYLDSRDVSVNKLFTNGQYTLYYISSLQ